MVQLFSLAMQDVEELLSSPSLFSDGSGVSYGFADGVGILVIHGMMVEP